MHWRSTGSNTRSAWAKPPLHMTTLAKDGDLHSRRRAAAFLKTPAALKKLFDTLGPRFGSRNGGYSRIVRL